ncbi:MAG: hemolysin family protein [Natronomonas sp.]
MFLTAGTVAIVLLVAVSAFFSASEISLFSLEEHRLGTLATEPGGDVLVGLRENPHRLLVTILVGNNFVNVAIASLTTALLVDRLPGGGGTAVAVATVVASTIVLVFGEIVPKSYGVGNPERVALRIARPIRWIQTALYPVVVFFETVTDGINHLTGGGRDIERPYITREEIVALVETAEELGIIEGDEQAMIERIFRFNTTTVGSVMVPRVDVVAVDAAASVEDAIDACLSERVTRLPVYEGDFSRVLGYVDIRDLVAVPEDASLRSLTNPALHVFEGQEVDEVLAELQAGRTELAIVYDEFGSVEGLVTTEDIVEEIVGEIFDIGEEPSVLVLSESTASVQGGAATREINGEIGTHLPETGGTVAGLLAKRLDRPAEPGDVIEVADARLTVRSVENNRIRRVHVEREAEAPLEEEK